MPNPNPKTEHLVPGAYQGRGGVSVRLSAYTTAEVAEQLDQARQRHGRAALSDAIGAALPGILAELDARKRE